MDFCRGLPMPAEDPLLNPDTDLFKPPAIPTEVGCLHCQQTYESYLIEWRVSVNDDGKRYGFWCCPTPGCDGRGFGFDIFPTDPEYRDEDGELMWSSDDDEDDDSEMEFDDLDSDDRPQGPRPTDSDQAPN
jgi:hypothetical protein